MKKVQQPPQYQQSRVQETKTTSDQSNFILKAYEIISNLNNNGIIHWSKTGYSFIIQNIDKFQQDILPKYFRHNRYQSFVRQLNMYDFHKVRNGDYYCENKSQFRHDEFYRSNYPNILNIKRKGFKAKPIGKQNSRKNHKNNSKRIKKVRKNKMFVPNKAQKKVQIQEIYESNEKLSDEEEVSMKIDIESEQQNVDDDFIPKIIDITQKFNPTPYIQSITQEITLYFQQNRHKNRVFQQGFNRKLNFHIQIAQMIKQKWSSLNASTKNDTHNMKQIYYRVKTELQKEKPDKIQKKQHSNYLEQYPHLQSLEQLISMQEQEEIIIQSIFKKQIRSTLISINSETYLHHQKMHKKNDLLMNL